MTVRRGDLRAFALRGTVHYALIHAWGGNPDSLALMVSTDHRVYFRFADSTIDPIETGLLMSEERDAARDDLLAWLETKAGKTLVRDARGASTASIDVHGQIHQREQPMMPSDGAGYPHFADPPAKLHAGEFPAWLSARFERYLFLRPQYEATLPLPGLYRARPRGTAAHRDCRPVGDHSRQCTLPATPGAAFRARGPRR